MIVSVYDHYERELYAGAWVVFVGEDTAGSAWEVDTLLPHNEVVIWDHVTDGGQIVDARELVLCE